MQSHKKNFNVPTPVAVIGMGKSGEAALSLLLAFGIPRTSIYTFDQKHTGADLTLPEQLLPLNIKSLVVSPGVPLASKWLQDLLISGVQLFSELTLACQVLVDEKIIGITGALGKSTTTAALGAAALIVDPNAFVGGNLGTPLSQYAIDVLANSRTRAKYIILELSSFQLENCKGLSLIHSIITFLSPNHLERYKDLDHYYQTKFKITALTTGRCIFNQNGGDLSLVYEKFLPKNILPLWTNPANVPQDAFNFENASLLGIHNRDNLALALAVIQLENLGKKAESALHKFSGLDHRLQKVGEYKNILFVNDSKATALDSVLVAADSILNLKRPGKIHLLLGGRDKNLPWKDLGPLEFHRQFRFYFFGECREQAKSQSQLDGDCFENLGPALNEVFKNAKPGDSVLLSPGGTSMDEFKNFEERGHFFVKAVREKFGP